MWRGKWRVDHCNWNKNCLFNNWSFVLSCFLPRRSFSLSRIWKKNIFSIFLNWKHYRSLDQLVFILIHRAVKTYFAVLIALGGPWMVTIRFLVPGENVPFLDIWILAQLNCWISTILLPDGPITAPMILSLISSSTWST